LNTALRGGQLRRFLNQLPIFQPFNTSQHLILQIARKRRDLFLDALSGDINFLVQM
jgi:hypothetical protein